MQQLKDQWINFLFKWGNVLDFIGKLEKTEPSFFFVTMHNQEEIVDYVKEHGLKNRTTVLDLVEKNTEVTEENLQLSKKFTSAEKEFIQFLCEQVYLEDHELSNEQELRMLRELLYTDTVFDPQLKRQVLASTGTNRILQGITLKRVNGRIIGFLKDVYEPETPDTLYLQDVYIAHHPHAGYQKQLILDVMHVKKFQQYRTHVHSTIPTALLESIGFKKFVNEYGKNILKKDVPENNNRMLIITNTYGVMEERSFRKATEGMDEYEWRVHPDSIKLIEKRQKEAVYLNILPNRTKEQEKRLQDLQKRYNDWFHFTINEVDLSRKWGLLEYDSSYSVTYFDENKRFANFLGYV